MHSRCGRRKKILLIDLDAQSNSSLILLGGERWIEAQRSSRNVAAYIEDRLYSIEQTKILEYLMHEIGDVEAGARQTTRYVAAGGVPAFRGHAG